MTDGWPYRLVSFDLDGTLTRVHGWEVLASAAGRLPEYQTTNRRFLAHEIDEDRHLLDLLKLAVGIRLDEVERLLESTPKVRGIAETVIELRRRGSRVALLTHNPTYVTDWYRRRFGFDDAEGTPGASVVDGRVGDPGPGKANKMGGLAQLLERAGVPAGAAAHVGDGWADATVFRHVAAGVAFNSLQPDVDAAADAAVHADDLRAVVPVLAGLRPRAV